MSAAPAPAAAPALPAPWLLKTTADGARSYYLHPATKQRLTPIEPATPASAGWGWLYRDRQKVYTCLATGAESFAWPPAPPKRAAGGAAGPGAKRARTEGGEGGGGEGAGAPPPPPLPAPLPPLVQLHPTPTRLPTAGLRIIAMTNRGQRPMLRNMLRSAQAVGMDLGLFDVYLTPEGAATPAEAAAFGSAHFASVTALKLALIAREAAAHAAVLWVDNDIVFFRNPLDDLLARAPVPFLMQNDQWSPCTGFWLLRAQAARDGGAAAAVLARSLAVMALRDCKDSDNDQAAFARACKESRCSPALLEDALYPNGRVYFERRVQARALLVHCNYLKTTAEKEARFLEHGLWDPREDVMERVRVVQLQHGDLHVPGGGGEGAGGGAAGGAAGSAAGGAAAAAPGAAAAAPAAAAPAAAAPAAAAPAAAAPAAAAPAAAAPAAPAPATAPTSAPAAPEGAAAVAAEAAPAAAAGSAE